MHICSLTCFIMHNTNNWEKKSVTQVDFFFPVKFELECIASF